MNESAKYSRPFRFQQFHIRQQHAAMKVGTDGVLLGCWAGRSSEGNLSFSPELILDIGTGTGLIALMMAQRFSGAEVHAVEFDAEALTDAERNFSESPFASRLHLHPVKIQDYSSDRRFDLIVSNPPYFDQALLSESEQKIAARHTVHLSLSELFAQATQRASDTARFAVVLPADSERKAIQEAVANHWWLMRRRHVASFTHKPIIRVLLEFSRQRPELIAEEEKLILYDAPFQRTGDFNALAAGFYLEVK